MGITVIPALASGKLPGTASAAAGTGEGAAGDFAALLNGELLSLMGAATEAGGIAASAAKDEIAGDERADEAGGHPDAALLASLFGHPAATENAARSVHTAAKAADAGVASGDVRATGSGTRPNPEPILATQGEPSAARATPEEAASTFDKLLQNTTAPGRSAAPAANIAAETPASEAPPVVPTQVASTAPSQASDTGLVHSQRHGINAHLQSAAWPQQFGDKIVWLARNDQQSAQLNINPPQLGPVQITLNLSGDQASIAFASPHAEVRQAIESAMPQLKEMLSSAGINLGQANVGANLSQQRSDTPFADANGTRSADENAILPANDKGADTAGTSVLQRGRGLVDLFA
ncbi:MAG TPA: flagellar hook-length control protein FliK [Azonexus sp.]